MSPIHVPPPVGRLMASVLLLFTACRPDDTPSRTAAPSAPEFATATGGCSGSQKPAGSAEGEVFGIVFENGQRTCSLWTVSLAPHADAQSRLHMASYKPSLVADWKWANMFEWWDPLALFPCKTSAQTLNDYVQNGSGYAEVPHATSNPKEGHCVRPGRYLFSFSGDTRQFDVDYIQPSGQFALNSGTGVNEAIEVTAYSPSLNTWQDLVINIDLTTVHPGDAPILEIQNAGSTPYLNSFSNQASPTGTAADWFRFSVMRSTSNWNFDSRGKALARLYFDGNDLSQATAYYSYIPEGIPVLRLRRFPNPTTANKQYTVGLELMRPDEDPANAPTVTRTVTITRINPDLAPGTITAPSGGSLGNPLSVTVQERNLGTSQFAPVEANWTGKVYLSLDAVLSPATDRLVDTYVETRTIDAGQTISTPRTFLVPTNLAPGTYYVLASLDANNGVIESNEGNNVGTSSPVTIAAAPPIANASFEGRTTWRTTDQVLSASGSSQGANIQYRWRSDAGGAWTPYSSSLTYEFPGHSSAGTHVVTLEVKDMSSGLSATDVDTITVQDFVITMTGPTFITVKANYTYTATVSSTWRERFPPSTTWSSGIGPQTTYTRTWSAGCYEVQLRADASGGGVLKRGRRNITVAIGTGCQPA